MAAKDTRAGRSTPKPLRLLDLEDRIDALVAAINRANVGAVANRSSVIRDALKGGGLDELERRYGISPPKKKD